MGAPNATRPRPGGSKQPVYRPLREGLPGRIVDRARPGDVQLPRSIGGDQGQVGQSAPFTMDDEHRPVRGPRWSRIGGPTEAGSDVHLVRTVRVHHPDVVTPCSEVITPERDLAPVG